MTQKTFWLSVAALYSLTLSGLVIKWLLNELVPLNIGQIIILLFVPFLWGALPIVLALVWLAILRFDLRRAKMGLQGLAAIYLVVLFSRLLPSFQF